VYLDNIFIVEGATCSGIFTNYHQAQVIKYERKAPAHNYKKNPFKQCEIEISVTLTDNMS